MSQQAGFPFSRGQALVDLHFLDLMEGELGRAENAWPGLMALAQEMKGWHQWLMIGRLMAAKAELALRMHRPSEAAAAATDAIKHARAMGRRKYAVIGRAVLGSALAELGRPEHALRELRRARAGASRLRHPPSVWEADLRLARALGDGGYEAEAESALESARASIDRFASELSPQRRAAFLSTMWAQNPELGQSHSTDIRA